MTTLHVYRDAEAAEKEHDFAEGEEEREEEGKETLTATRQWTRRAMMLAVTGAVLAPGAVGTLISARHRRHLREYCNTHAAEIDRWFASDLASLRREREQTKEPLSREVLTEIIWKKAEFSPEQ